MIYRTMELFDWDKLFMGRMFHNQLRLFNKTVHFSKFY